MDNSSVLMIAISWLFSVDFHGTVSLKQLFPVSGECAMFETNQWSSLFAIDRACTDRVHSEEPCNVYAAMER